MLAKAPPSRSPSLVFSFSSFSVPEPFSDSRTPLRFHLRYPLNSPGKWKKLPAYKRIPMENAGAYQLIDEATGDKFIVWGGSDDSPIPSERVLSWKPDSSIAAPKPKSSPSSSSSAKSLDKSAAERRVRLGHGFGRLKVQQVRELIKRSPRTAKQEFAPSPSAAHDDCDTRGQPLDFIAARRIRTSAQLNLEETRAKDVKSTDNAVNATVNNSTNSSPRHASSLLRGWAAVGSSEEMKRPHTRTPADVGFFSRKSFRDLGCTDAMVESLRRLQFVRPSHIQAMAYEPILRGKSCVIADQSGSGKTLAYLAPTVQRLRQEELLGIARSLPKSPRVVILVPTAELASQVLNSCRSIAKVGVPFRSMVVTGGFRQRTQLDNLQQELDVVIATPGRFMYLLQEGFLEMIHLRCIILDEVDILFGDKGFEQVLQTLISTAPVEAQYLFVTATLPVDIYNKLVEIFPDCEVIMGPGMHRISSRLEEVLVDCSGSVEEEKTQERAFQNKKSALVQLAEQFPVPRTIVFCNKIETCRKVENVLKRFDRKGGRIKALPFHAALDQELRLLNMKEFLDTKLTESSFLICTDRVSRGIDFTNVDHVVLFDFPRDPSEYVRRVGRTARGAGSKGKAFVFVVGKQVSLARRIMERNKKGHPLHHVPSVMESGFL